MDVEMTKDHIMDYSDSHSIQTLIIVGGGGD